MTYIVIDTSYLAWRSFHTTGGLSHNGKPTGVLFGVLRDLITVQDKFNTDNLIFCFDYGKSKRREIYPQYKRKDKEYTKEEKKRRKTVRSQLEELRTKILPELGYGNILFQDGYEADDCIASVTQNDTHSFIIFSADKDLYQLLSNRVSIYNGKSLLEVDGFLDQYHIEPKEWSEVKAIAGCYSDNVAGVDGVGEKTACTYLQGNLKEKTKAFQRIEQAQDIIKRNRKLVKLPFPGTQKFTIQEDHFSKSKWRELIQKLGMRSLVR